MKPLTIALLVLLVVTLCHAQSEVDLVQRYGRDIAKEISLADAVAAFNQKYPDANPLTEEEVIAAIRNWHRETHPVSEPVYMLYLRVAEQRVLPKGMYLSRETSLQDSDYAYEVDWKDLTFTSVPWRQTERQKDPHPELGFGYNYRIRARYISSRHLTDREKEENRKREETMRKLMEDLKAPNKRMKADQQ